MKLLSWLLASSRHAILRARSHAVSAACVRSSSGRITREDVEAWAELEEARVEVAPGVSLEAPRQGAGDLVLLCGFGAGLAWGTALIRW